jgi:drug/metabolite transporter (DMT)-like permease
VKTRRRIPLRALFFSLIILTGVILIQVRNGADISINQFIAGVLPVVLAAFAYPLGNRKMMEVCGGRLDTFQRVLGMTLASLPFWLILAVYGMTEAGLPSMDQVTQSFIVAISSGVIATTLFFIATDRVRDHEGKLASVEATQSTQVLFVLFGEVILLSSPIPDGLTMIGILVIMLGMFLHSFFSNPVRVKAIAKI